MADDPSAIEAIATALCDWHHPLRDHAERDDETMVYCRSMARALVQSGIVTTHGQRGRLRAVVNGLSDGLGETWSEAERCQRCGGPNPAWSAESPLWNYVMRGNDINGEARYRDMVCARCFLLCAAEAGLPPVGYRLAVRPAPDGLVYVTPSGRVWDPERFLWVDLE